MPTTNNFQEILLRELKELISPVLDAASSAVARDEFLTAIGWDLTEMDGTRIGYIQTKLSNVNTAYTIIDNWVQNPPQSLAQLPNILNDAQALIDAVQDLKNTSGTNLLQGFDKIGRDI